MTLPITVRCECGDAVAADLGDEVTCARCGRRYDTSDINPGAFAGVQAVRARLLFVSRLGVVIVAAAGLGGYFVQGLAGVALAAPAAALLWWRFVYPRVRSRQHASLGELPSRSLKATRP